MSTLSFEKITLPSSTLGGESTLPPFTVKGGGAGLAKRFLLDEDDALYIGYGTVPSAFPYRNQDLYDRELKETEYDVCVLENEALKALFLPALGGKLWSLYDKKQKRELLFRNSCVRPCNLAVRNAWTSGGVEWNCGFLGHHPYTCSQIHTAKTKLEDGTPVLRFYYFERVRAVIVQMDFFLPDGEEFLYARMRITNPNETVTPMYWWSNIAVPQEAGARTVVPADESYTSDGNSVIKLSVPMRAGIDVSYPLNNPTAVDYFWKTRHETRRYVTALNAQGYGLCEVSTRRLVGRKLFVWGNSQGGEKWQNFLTKDDEPGSYSEIQCGLAHSQYECLPMPPHATWEWLEGYGALRADPKKVHGEWSGAQKEVEARLDQEIPEEKLDRLLAETKKTATSPAEVVIPMNDGFGALEILRRERTDDNNVLMCRHLDFGETNAAQAVWLSLLTDGTVGEHTPCEIPASYMGQDEWVKLLEDAARGKDKDNFYCHFLLGAAYLAKDRPGDAKAELLLSEKLTPYVYTDFLLGLIARDAGDGKTATCRMLAAFEKRRDDLSLVKEVLRVLYENGEREKTVAIVEGAPDAIRRDKRVSLYYAFALERLGRIAEAERILLGEDGRHALVVPDIREGEISVTALWFDLQRAKGIPENEIGEPPKDLDFRMNAKSDEWNKK